MCVQMLVTRAGLSGSCADGDLYLPIEPPLSQPEMKSNRVERTLCTEDPASLIFPLKAWFVIDDVPTFVSVGVRLFAVLGMLGAGCAEVAVDAPETFGSTSKLIRSPRALPGRYIVVLNEPRVGLAADVGTVAAELASSLGGEVDHVYRAALRGFSVKLSDEQAQRLSEDPRVAYVQEDGEVKLSATQSGATWGIDRIDQAALPLSQTYTYEATGIGVNAYIIDTGIRTTHAEFGTRAVSGFTVINDGHGTSDCNGHGTHVAGTVGGTTYGVAKNVKLYAVRVLNCEGSGSDSQVVAGVDWVTQNHVKPAVANMSLGSPGSQATDDAVKASISAGVTYVVAAGNDNVDACGTSPARVPAAVTVGATAMNDQRSSFSNFGACLDLFAPGSDIVSAVSTADTGTKALSGTSMASPHVAGAVAMYLQKVPSAIPAQVATAITTNAIAAKVIGPGSGSPNRLLQTVFISAPPVCKVDGLCESSCNPVDEDCFCAADSTCDARCPDLGKDPDCPKDCGKNDVCALDNCPKPDPDCVEVGQPCSSQLQCKDRRCVNDAGHPGFYCSRPCTGDMQCPSGMRCGVAGVCNLEPQDAVGIGGACTVGDTSCADGGVCAASDGVQGVCALPCTDETECPSSNVCDRLSGGERFCRPLSTASRSIVAGGGDEYGCAQAPASSSLWLWLTAVSILGTLRRRSAFLQ